MQPQHFAKHVHCHVMKKKVENELDHLEQKGIITPVQYSYWAAPVVPVLKRDGSVRLCGDFSVSINPEMEVNQYPLPQPNEMFTNLNGGVLYSKLDFSEAYLQIELDEESQKLVVIDTHKGLFQYSRLPFGFLSCDFSASYGSNIPRIEWSTVLFR